MFRYTRWRSYKTKILVAVAAIGYGALICAGVMRYVKEPAYREAGPIQGEMVPIEVRGVFTDGERVYWNDDAGIGAYDGKGSFTMNGRTYVVWVRLPDKGGR